MSQLKITKGGEEFELSSLLSDQSPATSFDMEEMAQHSKAMDKIAALVNVRERTALEVLRRLKEVGFDAEVAGEAVGSAIRCGLIDEERYAIAFVCGKVHGGWGKEKILGRLRADGVSERAISVASEHLRSKTDEYDAAYLQLEKHPARSKNPRATYVRRLVGKGYSQGLAIRVTDDFLSSQDN